MLTNRLVLISLFVLLAAAAIAATAAHAAKPNPNPPNPEILYYSTKGKTPGLWKMDADGGNKTFVLRGANYAGWSPDGSQMAANGYASPLGAGLYRINADGTNPVLLDPAGLHSFSQPTWSPATSDAPTYNRIAYMRGSDCSLMMVDADGGIPPVQLIQGDCNCRTACSYNDPDWSRDGSVLAVWRLCRPEGPGTSALIIVPPFAPAESYSLMDNVHVPHLAWARQHDWIAFALGAFGQYTDGQYTAELELVDGRYAFAPPGPTLLWAFPGGGSAYAFAPDDSKLLVYDGSLWTHALATGVRTKLLANDGSYPDWKR